MTERIKSLLSELHSGDYRRARRRVNETVNGKTANLEEHMNAFRRACAVESPAIMLDDFGFCRGTDLCVLSCGGNLTPSYSRVINVGFDTIAEELRDRIIGESDEEKKNYGLAMLECLEKCLEMSEEHKKLAKSVGNERLYNALCKIPHKPAESFYEALVFVRLIIYFLRLAFADHIGLGRFDQYMLPFFERDLGRGVSREELFETLEEFFIALNIDTDLYPGVQQGDNGQSLMLGGFGADGKYAYNELSRMCMRASLELSLIDPKINLRVGKDTPDEIFEFATLLTKQGLGFPQYCNDDIVVPGLIRLGYAHEDALDYTVAACWEFIIPGKGADIPNIAVMNFPLVVGRAIDVHLEESETFDGLLDCVRDEIVKECDAIVEKYRGRHPQQMPLLSVFVDGCTESLTDVWRGGAKYYNFGCHGTGIANAADALAAVKKCVYDEGSLKKNELLEALRADFDGYSEVRSLLRSAPKMGNNDEYVDELASVIMQTFSKNINGRDTYTGGVWRAGTGSAHEYYFSARKCPATADGRRAEEPYSSSFSPSLDVRTDGILSVISSFTKHDLSDIINGGPLTLELHDTVLRNDIGIKKTAQLVKTFIALGGHQLQLNAIGRERLLDAEAHPERYPNLIVRVWGWSGYFSELDRPFREHIIRRTEYTL